MAETVIKVLNEQPSHFEPSPLELSIKKKIEIIAREIYGADGVEFTKDANTQIRIHAHGADKLPICIAKTQHSPLTIQTFWGGPRV